MISNIISFGSYEEFLKHYNGVIKVISIVGRQNQDLSFNKYLNQLFGNISKGIGRLKGKKLFKGILMMLIRDVKNEESGGAFTEMMSSLSVVRSKENNFLTCLFQGEVIFQCLNYFEQPIFNDEINNIRKEILVSMNKKRWLNGRDFLESIKITMTQIFVDDDTDMDLHKINITCEHLIKEGLKNFFEGEGFFKSNNMVFKKTIFFKEKEESYDIQIMHQDIKFEINDLNSKDYEKENFYPAMQIIETFASQTREYSKSIHNEWVLSLAKFIEEFLLNRMEIVIKNFEEQFKI